MPQTYSNQKSVYEWEMILENHHQELFFPQVVPGLIKDSCIQNCPSTSQEKNKQNKRNEETLEETGCSLPIVTSLALRESRVGSRCRCSPRPFMSHQRSKAQNLQRVTWSSEGMVMVDDLDDLDDMVSIIYPNRSLHGHPRNSATHRPNQPTRHQPNSYHRTANDSKISIARATN